MAFIGLRVPSEVSRVLDQLEVPGTVVPANQKHITIVHLGSKVPVDTLGDVIITAHEILSKEVPFQVTLERIDAFPSGDDGVPIIAPILSEELQSIHKKLIAAFDADGLPYSKRFPEYKPHVTLSYGPEGSGDGVQAPMGPLPWSVYEIVLWGGDAGEDNLTVTFPLALPGKTALWHRLVQGAMRFGFST